MLSSLEGQKCRKLGGLLMDYQSRRRGLHAVRKWSQKGLSAKFTKLRVFRLHMTPKKSQDIHHVKRRSLSSNANLSRDRVDEKFLFVLATAQRFLFISASAFIDRPYCLFYIQKYGQAHLIKGRYPAFFRAEFKRGSLSDLAHLYSMRIFCSS